MKKAGPKQVRQTISMAQLKFKVLTPAPTRCDNRKDVLPHLVAFTTQCDINCFARPSPEKDSKKTPWSTWRGVHHTHTHKIQDVDQHIIDHIQMCTHKMVVAHSRQASVQRCLSPQMLSWVNGSLITLS